MAVIETVDFSPLSLTKPADKINWQSDGLEVGKQMVKAFEDIGFVYLINTGISEDQINKYHKIFSKYFDLPLEIKNKSLKPADNNHGYIPIGVERFRPHLPHDIKEAFNMSPPRDKTKELWPSDEDAPGFKSSFEVLFSDCTEVGNRISQALALGLNLDKDFILKSHSNMGKGRNNVTTLRTLYYPPVPENIEPNQVRCGEHSDFGIFTMLFQDELGGLQVKQRNGEFTEAKPIPGAMLVNVADLLMRWTSDRLVSTRHRVLIPNDHRSKKVRQSTAFFLISNDDFPISSVTNDNKYPSILTSDYCVERFQAFHGKFTEYKTVE